MECNTNFTVNGKNYFVLYLILSATCNAQETLNGFNNHNHMRKALKNHAPTFPQMNPSGIVNDIANAASEFTNGKHSFTVKLHLAMEHEAYKQLSA